MSLCTSAQWGCSLAVKLDDLSAGQRDGSSPEVARPVDAATAPEAPSSPPPRDAHESDSAAVGSDGQIADENDAQIRAVDGLAPEDGMVVADATIPSGEVDAAAPDTPDGSGGPNALDAVLGQPDTGPSDTSSGDLSAEVDVGSSATGDASGDPGDGPDAGADARPLACASSPLVSATLELANALPAQTACGYVPAEVPSFYAAVDPTVFAGSAACGACLILETSAATVEARIVDVGPSASPPNQTAVAVSRPALTVLAPDGSTFITKGVDWHFAPCTLTAPGMTFKIQTGSNASYAAVLIENHRHRLAKVEYKIRAAYYPLTRSTYNYWIASQGMGTGPFTLRMTDELGQIVEQTGIPLAPGSVFKGQAQFPACSP